jgi:hypothetical protein
VDALYVLDLARGYRPVTLLAAAALLRGGGEFLVMQREKDRHVVQAAIDRFRPARLYAMSGTVPPQKRQNEIDEPLRPEALPHDEAHVLAWLVEHALPAAEGVVLIPAHSPSWAIKGAALAARLGYLLWPVEEAAALSYTAPPDLAVLAVGEAPGSLTDALQGRPWTHLAGDRAIAQYLGERGIPVDYVVLVNSADITPPEYGGQGLSGLWVSGISLLAPLLASYRPVLVIDARTPRPDSRLLEATVRQKVHDVGLRPEFFAILASPGAAPFAEKPARPFGDGEDSVRDIHLRHDDDLFFDCAEGRLFGQTVGQAGLQLLSTKHYSRLSGPFRNRALLAMKPHVESGVTFAIDEAVGRAQLSPLLQEAGLEVVPLYDTDCSPDRIAEHLPSCGLFLFAGHGQSYALSTHAQPLYAESLPPQVAPGVVYACACSTLYPKPLKVTADGGFSVEDEEVPPAEVIGAAFIERGALAYVGGLTVEDALLNTAMYVVFVNHLVLKGASVGQAVRAARNYALLVAATLSQQAPEELRRYAGDLARTLQQQVLLGDPAFVPYPAARQSRPPALSAASADDVTISATVPEGAWAKVEIPVFLNEPGREFHRARLLDAWLPAGPDIYTWGETYTVAPDREGLSDRGILGGYLHLHADLPPGRVPSHLVLEAAEVSPDGCLLCGGREEVADPVARFSRFTVPFIGKRPPVHVDCKDGWPFAVEERTEGMRVHWLLPVVAVDDRRRHAALLRRARFRLSHLPGVRAEGRVEVERGAGVGGTPGALEGSRGAIPPDVLLTFGRPLPPAPASHPSAAVLADPRSVKQAPRLQVVAQTLTGPGGRFSCWLPAEELSVAVGPLMPVYRHCAEAALSYRPDTVGGLHPARGLLAVPVAAPVAGRITGVVVDKRTGRPLSGARVRAWQGEAGEGGWRGGYVGEAKTDPHGRFEFTAAPGRYIVAAVARTDYRYFPGTAGVQVYAEKPAAVMVTLEPGAVLHGSVRWEGSYRPKGAAIRLVEHHGSLEKPVATGLIRRDGRFEVLAPAFRPFDIVIQQEGYRLFVDDHGGAGYHLDPGETTEITLAVQSTSG